MRAEKDPKTGKWLIQYRYTDWQGKRRKSTKRGFKTKREAEEWLRNFLMTQTSDFDMKFDEFLKLYYADMETRLREHTMRTKKYIIELKILPYFGQKRINDIKAADIRNWQNELIKQGYSPTYLKTINNQLSAVFNYAVKYYDLKGNPYAKAGSMGKSKAEEMNFWTKEDEYYQQFQKRNPNLYVFSAHLHMDEATPHLHIDFVPFTTGSKRGLNMEEDELFLSYADVLLGQMPCFRMNRSIRRNRLYLDPNLKGIIYHTIKFCDYYGFEYASIKRDIKVPLLKIETDFTSQSAGQLLTRIQAFEETIEGSEDMDPGKGISEEARKKMESGIFYVAGIDSGSTSTDVVILDQDGKIKSTMIIPTGGGAMMSAEKSLDLAIEKAGIKKEEIVRIDTTGYGRSYIDSGDDSITEITCHAKGANYLNPNVRTIIDIGGQDIKAISIDGQGAVKNFLMNDKCAAGTGRFLEMMAKTLGLSLEEMSVKGLEWKHNIVISSMCTVFAESEVVSLVAQNKDVADIIHGLNVSVASKVGALAARLGKDHPGEYMMTGGVAKNQGIIQALEEKLGAKLYICDEAQLCGALGAALFAYEKCKGSAEETR